MKENNKKCVACGKDKGEFDGYEKCPGLCGWKICIHLTEESEEEFKRAEAIEKISYILRT